MFYKKYKNNNSKSKGYGKWYLRPVKVADVGLESLALSMQESCTVKRADVLAVLSELGPTIKRELQDGKRVIIPYLGSFKLSFASTGETDADKINPAQNIRRTYVLFTPEYTMDHSSTKARRIYELTRGVAYADIELLANGKQKTTGTSGDGNTGSGDGSGGGDNTGSGTEGGADVRP